MLWTNKLAAVAFALGLTCGAASGLAQMGELVDTANRVYDPTETRIFVTHASPAREGLLNQLSVTLKADFSGADDARAKLRALAGT